MGNAGPRSSTERELDPVRPNLVELVASGLDPVRSCFRSNGSWLDPVRAGSGSVEPSCTLFGSS